MSETEYKGFRIVPRFDGFQLAPDRPMGIASFVVSKNDIICVFAFGVGLLSQIAEEDFTEEDLWDGAQLAIKDYIDSDRIGNLEEFTFELQNREFVEVEDVKWWDKKLRELFG